jgi:hypothetical protein
MGDMNENEPLKQETLTDSESRVSGQVEASAVATTADTVVPKAGSRRGTSFSWFRLIVAIAAVGMLFMAIAPRVPGLKGLLGERPVTWEYRVVNVSPDVANDRGTTTAGGLAQNQITVSDAQLNALGLQGWELAGSYLEMETAFPNFGSADYVTGLRDNVRPQRLVLILKRSVQEWLDQSSK